jgi:hypothetical protein
MRGDCTCAMTDAGAFLRTAYRDRSFLPRRPSRADPRNYLPCALLAGEAEGAARGLLRQELVDDLHAGRAFSNCRSYAFHAA